MDKQRFEKQLAFILEIDKEKNIFRQTHLSNHGRQENDAEHAWHMAIMIYLLKEYANEQFDIAKAMNLYSTDMTKEKAAEAAVEAVKTLSLRVNIPQHLSDLGIQESDLDRLATAAFADVCTPGNPREVTKEIILDLYKKAL